MHRMAFLLLSTLVLSACRGVVLPTSPALTSPTPGAPLAVLTPTPTRSSEPAHRTEQREDMVVQTIERRGVQDPSVLRAMRLVPRHRFVPDDYQDLAYTDRPLPIGYRQTISQPYIVAWMTELLKLAPGARVLEIGTGSGYQAAVLAALPGVEVYTIEIVPQLAEQSGERLARLGYTKVHAMQGDGYYGWAEHAPYDAIIVTAAPDHVPQPLVEQLADGGRLVIPIGPPGSYQTLWRFVRTDGELQATNMGGVAFVPFTGAGLEGASP